MKPPFLIFFLLTFYFFFSALTFAQNQTFDPCYETVQIKDPKDPTKVTTERVATFRCLPVYLGKILGLLFPLAGAVALAMLIWGGIKFITSGGDPKQAESARATLTWAIAGLVVIFLAYALLRIISFITGVKFPGLPF